MTRTSGFPTRVSRPGENPLYYWHSQVQRPEVLDRARPVAEVFAGVARGQVAVQDVAVLRPGGNRRVTGEAVSDADLRTVCAMIAYACDPTAYADLAQMLPQGEISRQRW